MTHKGKLALLKYWKNLWEHKLKRSSQTPCLSWVSECTWSPWGKTCHDWVYRSGACPAARVGTGGLYPSLPPGRVGTGLTPITQWFAPLCAPEQESWAAQELAQGAQQEQCLCFGHAGGVLDLIVSGRKEMLTTPETDHQNSLDDLQLSQFSQPKKPMQWGRQAACQQRGAKKPPKQLKSICSVNRREADHICSAALSPKVSGNSDKLDTAPLIRNKMILFGISGWVKEHLHRALQNPKAQTLILLHVAPIL